MMDNATNGQLEQLGNFLLAEASYYECAEWQLDKGHYRTGVAKTLEWCGLVKTAPFGLGYDNWGRMMMRATVTDKGRIGLAFGQTALPFKCGVTERAFLDGFLCGKGNGEPQGDEPAYREGYRSGVNERRRRSLIRKWDGDQEHGGDANAAWETLKRKLGVLDPTASHLRVMREAG